MRPLFVLVGLLSLSFVSAAASAQRITDIKKGVRVRVTPEGGERFTGTLVSSTADSITLVSEKTFIQHSAPVQEFKLIEVSKGRSRMKGASVKGLIGLGIGLVSGGALGALTYTEPKQKECTPDPDNIFGGGCGFGCLIICSRGEATVALGMFGGGAGFIIGTIAGAVTGRESWAPVKFR